MDTRKYRGARVKQMLIHILFLEFLIAKVTHAFYLVFIRLHDSDFLFIMARIVGKPIVRPSWSIVRTWFLAISQFNFFILFWSAGWGQGIKPFLFVNAAGVPVFRFHGLLLMNVDAFVVRYGKLFDHLTRFNLGNEDIILRLKGLPDLFSLLDQLLFDLRMEVLIHFSNFQKHLISRHFDFIIGIVRALCQPFDNLI